MLLILVALVCFLDTIFITMGTTSYLSKDYNYVPANDPHMAGAAYVGYLDTEAGIVDRDSRGSMVSESSEIDFIGNLSRQDDLGSFIKANVTFLN